MCHCCALFQMVSTVVAYFLVARQFGMDENHCEAMAEASTVAPSDSMTTFHLNLTQDFADLQL